MFTVRGLQRNKRKFFEETKESFLRLRSSIVPMFKNPINEEDFNSLTGFVEVVPSYYEDDYLSAYEEGNYFDTVKFYLPLAYSQFFKLAKMGQIYKRQPTVFCRAKYDKELGLLVDEFETNILE
ncbi:hypothetical protein JGI13_01850 [Candidatus Kryptonium thompsonii]|nr:hypothetical protein JGI13_01850 [Candidatus Kryptonium thompsoni]